jgi:MFS family permease
MRKTEQSTLTSSESASGSEGANNGGFGAYGWYVVLMGMAISIVAVLDRQVLSLLVEPIKADLAISDVQFSLLTGLAFSLFYALCGLPLGPVIDRRSRVAILSGGLALWSAATFLSGFARTYTALFAARVLVGVGEATLQPTTKSLITDLFYGRHLAKAISIVAVGSAIGGGLAFLAGAAVLHYVGARELIDLPLVGEVRPWQFVFMVVGLPGIVLAPIAYFTIREPQRRRVLVDGRGVATAATYGELWRFCREHSRAVGCLVFGYAIYSMAFQGMLSWTPAYLIRARGMQAADVGFTLGIVQLAVNVGMMLISGWWVDRRTARGATDGALQWSRGSALLGLLPMIAFPYVASADASLALVVLALVGTSGQLIGAVPLMQLMPSQLRGKAMVSYMLLSNIVAGVIGPTLIATFNQEVLGDPAKIGHSLSLIGSLALASTALIFTFGMRPYTASMAKLDRQTV